MTNRALIFGGRTGLLGQALMRTLKANQWHVTPIGRSDGDVLNISFVENCIKKFCPTHIFNAIAWTRVDDAEDDESMAFVVNRAFPAGLAQLAKTYDIHLTHYGSDYCFSGSQKKIYTEESIAEPLSAYGRSKLAGDEVVLNFAPDNSCVLRTAWLFGPGQPNFISRLIQEFCAKEKLSIVHDQVGSPTYSMDLARWSMLAAEKKLTGLYNAVNSGRASWYELACEAVSIAELTCYVTPITTDEWPYKAQRPPFSVLSNQKLTDAIGVTPRAWPQALREYIFSEHLNRDLIGA